MASFVCTQKPQALFYNQQGGARTCFSAVIELRGAASLSAPLALDVSLGYSGGECVADQSIMTLLDDALAPLAEDVAPVIGTKDIAQGGELPLSVKLRARVSEVSRSHAHQKFALLVRAAPAALAAAGLPSVGAQTAALREGICVGAVLVKSKINPPRRKYPSNNGKRAKKAEVGARESAHARKRAAIDVLTTATQQTMQSWGNAAVEVLRRVQWLPAGFATMASGGGRDVEQRDISRPIYRCPCCGVFKHGDEAARHGRQCDITALLRSAGPQRMQGEQNTTEWVKPPLDALDVPKRPPAPALTPAPAPAPAFAPALAPVSAMAPLAPVPVPAAAAAMSLKEQLAMAAAAARAPPARSGTGASTSFDMMKSWSCITRELAACDGFDGIDKYDFDTGASAGAPFGV